MVENRELSAYRVLPRGEPQSGTHIGSQRPFGNPTETHLRDYWRTVWKHRSLIVSLAIGATMATAVYTLTQAPRYTAKAVLQIEPEAPTIAPIQEVQQLNSGAIGDKYDYYETQFQILKSAALITRVMNVLNLGNDERFAGSSSPRLSSRLLSLFQPGEPSVETADRTHRASQWLGKYASALSIEPVGLSRLVDVRFTHTSPALAAAIANKHVEEYINLSIDQRIAITERARDLLREEVARTKQRLLLAEGALNQFRKDKGIINIDGEKADIVSERLYDLNKELTKAQSERIRLESDYQLVESRNFESLAAVLKSPLVTGLKEEASKAEAERAELENQFFPGYPRLERALVRERQVKGRLVREIEKIVGGIESAFAAAKLREEELRRQLDEQRQVTLTQKTVGAEYQALAREVNNAATLHEMLLKRLNDVNVSGGVSVSNIAIFHAAEAPTSPTSPRPLRSLSIALATSLAAGILLAFFLEYLDNTLRTPDQVESRLGLPTLGIVPSFAAPELAYGHPGGKGDPAPPKRSGWGMHIERLGIANRSTATDQEPRAARSELAVVWHGRSTIAEAYRTIRTGILLSSADRAPRVTLFTSASPGEGKTCTSMNHAATLVQSGARVLLMDADLRKPRLHRVFDLANGHGLSTVLTGHSELEAAIRTVALKDLQHGNGRSGSGGRSRRGKIHAAKTNRNGVATLPAPELGELHVLPSGPVPPNPAELLGSRRMSETLELLRARYDYVVIDAAPVLPVTDAVPLSSLCDAVVLVVRSEDTTYPVVARARDRLTYARANLIGVVLNDVDVRSADYAADRGYYYGGYYGESGDQPNAG